MLPVLFIFTVIAFAYPPILIPIGLVTVIYFVTISHFDKKSKKLKKEIYDQKWAPELVFERRMKYAMNFEGRPWERNVEVIVGAKLIIDGAYAGLIKTSTGLEIWRCEHGHKSKATATRRSRSRFTANPSIQMARRCAEKNLSNNYAYYLSQAQKQRSGTRHKRALMQNSFFEPIYDTLKSFNFQCAYCGKPGLTKSTTHRDHVVPLHVGGSNSSENMLPVCSECNLSKGTRSVFEFLLTIESQNGILPSWVEKSETWKEFRHQK